MKPKKSVSKRVVASRNLNIAGGIITGYLRKGIKEAKMSSSSSLQVAPTTTNAKSFFYTCAGCDRPIRRDKFLLKACDKYWHENCLKCDRCNGRLGELGSTLYCKSNMNLCRQDYLELFGETGVCSVCEKVICASEMVMRAKKNVYHLECFACQLCSQRFCVGDRFYLCENKVICQYDYEEHILPIQRSLEQESYEHVPVYPPSNSEMPQVATYLEQPDYNLNRPRGPRLSVPLQSESEPECGILLALDSSTTKPITPISLVPKLDRIEAALGQKPADTNETTATAVELKMVAVEDVKTEENS